GGARHDDPLALQIAPHGRSLRKVRCPAILPELPRAAHADQREALETRRDSGVTDCAGGRIDGFSHALARVRALARFSFFGHAHGHGQGQGKDWPFPAHSRRVRILPFTHFRATDGTAMHWLLIGYMWIFIERPGEIWPKLEDLHVERIYMLFT